MAEVHELLLRARLDAAAIEAWIEAGWLAPQRNGGGQAVHALSERDLARARLIRDLHEDLGVNDDGVAVILALIDQMHGMRRALLRLASVIQRLPEPLRQEALANIRAAAMDDVSSPLSNEFPATPG